MIERAETWHLDGLGHDIPLTARLIADMQAALIRSHQPAPVAEPQTVWGHKPGCPVLTAAGNPQCTCAAAEPQPDVEAMLAAARPTFQDRAGLLMWVDRLTKIVRELETHIRRTNNGRTNRE